jgi:hypothetical protein
MSLIEATGAEAAIFTQHQRVIALRCIITLGGQASMAEIYAAVEDEMNPLGYTLSRQGRATLREVVNRSSVRLGWITRLSGQDRPWQITPRGRAFIESVDKRREPSPDEEEA